MELETLRNEVLSYGTGYLPDPNDQRDYVLTATWPVKEQTVMYEHLMQEIRNQKNEGVCVGFAATAVKEYYDNLQRGTHDYFSPRFVYYQSKLRDGIPNEEGTYPRTALQVMQELGTCFEHEWPYVPYQSQVPTDPTLNQRALMQRIQTYARLRTTRDMVANLILNGPFLAGILVTNGFYTDECLRTGLIDPTIKSDANSGGHAICVCGYDVDKRWFRIRNSWGHDYGDKGYNWATRDWLEENCLDAWSIVDDTAIDNGLTINVPYIQPSWFTRFKKYWSQLW